MGGVLSGIRETARRPRTSRPRTKRSPGGSYDRHEHSIVTIAGTVGLEVPSKGAHTLRHTAATRMVRGGASLKEVADILRHRSLETAMIYAKIDLATLVEVALPWPEVRS